MHHIIRKSVLALMTTVFGAGGAHASIDLNDSSGKSEKETASRDASKKDENNTKVAQAGTIFEIDEFLSRYGGTAPSVTPQRQRRVQPQRTQRRNTPSTPAPRDY